MSTTTQSAHRLAVIGPSDVVSGFQALGIDVFDVTKSEDALAAIKTLQAQSRDEGDTPYAVIFVIDYLLKDIGPEEYKKVTTGALPAVIAIPGLKADKEAGKRKLRALAEKAIGSDILGS